jgi:hypothetical protein
MASVTIQVTVGSDSKSGALTVTELFEHTMTLVAGAANDSVDLGGITDPQYIIVFGGTGVSFKLGAAGTDDLEANPFGAVSDEEGLGITEILLSNSDGVDHDVVIYAGE